jgi:PST family polysaccharide transporter
MLNKLAKASERLSSEHLKIISNTGWLFASKVFRMLVSLFVGAWVARYLGPDQYGGLQYALSFSSFFLPLSTAQMSPVITRDLVRDRSSSHTILGTAFTLQLLGGAIATLVCFAFSFLIFPSSPQINVLVGIVALKFVFNSFQPIENWFESQVASKFTVFADNIAFITSTTIKILLILNQASVIAFAIAISLEALFYSISLIVLYRKSQQNILDWRVDFSSLCNLAKDSFPLLLSSTACVIYISVDQVMLGHMIGSDAVGIYASAAILSEASVFLPVVISSSIYPLIIRSQALDRAIYQNRLQTFYDLISLAAYSLILIVLPLAGFLITSLYGKAYQAAIPILIVHIWSCLFSFQGIAQSKWIVAEGLQTFNLYSRLAGLVANVLLNLVLIPVYQGMGAAIATLISYAIGNYLFFLLIPQTRENAILMTKALCLPLRLPKLLKAHLA